MKKNLCGAACCEKKDKKRKKKQMSLSLNVLETADLAVNKNPVVNYGLVCQDESGTVSWGNLNGVVDDHGFRATNASGDLITDDVAAQVGSASGPSGMGEDSIAGGRGSVATENGAVAIGSLAEAKASSVAIGNNSKTGLFSGVAIGLNAQNLNNEAVSPNTVNSQSVSVGHSAKTYNVACVSIGKSTTTFGEESMALGSRASAGGDRSIAIGPQVNNEVEYSTKIGVGLAITQIHAVSPQDTSTQGAVYLGEKQNTIPSNSFGLLNNIVPVDVTDDSGFYLINATDIHPDGCYTLRQSVQDCDIELPTFDDLFGSVNGVFKDAPRWSFV